MGNAQDRKCAAKTRSGGSCGRTAGWGTPTPGVGRCRLHGGATPSHRTAASKELARRAIIRFGLDARSGVEQVDPRDVLAEELWRAKLTVDALDHFVSELEHGEGGIYGRTYHISGVATGEGKPHVLWTMWQEQRQHLARVASECVKAGVETKRVEIEQRHAQLMADVFRQVFGDPELGLDTAQRQAAMMTAARHLRLVAGA